MKKLALAVLCLGVMLGVCQDAFAVEKEKVYSLDKLHKDKGLLLDNKGTPVSGVVQARYPDGVLMQKNMYKDGKRHGRQILYGDNGRILTDATYTNGRTDGAVRIYYRTGALLGVVNFDNGRPLSGYCIPTTGIKQELSEQELKDFVLKGGKLPCPQL